MPSNKDKVSRTVQFAQSNEADRSLLQAIEQAMAERASSFNDLCKEALRQWLQAAGAQPVGPTAPESFDRALPHSTASPVGSVHSLSSAAAANLAIALQQKLTALQLQVAKLEGAVTMKQTLSFNQLEQQTHQQFEHLAAQIAALSDRLTQLETRPPTAAVPPELDNEPPVVPALEEDPLLSRLAPLLEDF